MIVNLKNHTFFRDFNNSESNVFQLVQLGILDTIELLLQKNSNNKMLKNTVIEILVDILSYVPYLFKEHIIEKIKSSENQYPSSVSNLLFELCDILTSNRDFGIKYEISKIIISLLDNEVHGNGRFGNFLEWNGIDIIRRTDGVSNVNISDTGNSNNRTNACFGDFFFL